jgi:hypothetical protein
MNIELISNSCQPYILDIGILSSTVLPISQVLFYIAGAIAAIYGVYKAQETFYQPQETEIFKAQFSQFDRVMSFLSSIRGTAKESEVEVALQIFRKINYFRLADYFQAAFLGIEIHSDSNRIYEEVDSEEYKAFFHGESHFISLDSHAGSLDRESWKRIQDWKSFELISISPSQLDDIQEKLSSIISNSYLLPSDVRKMLIELSSFIAERKYSSFVAVQKIAPLLPNVKYPGKILKDMIVSASSQNQRDAIFSDYYNNNFMLICKEERAKDAEISKKIEEVEMVVRKAYKLDQLLIGRTNKR